MITPLKAPIEDEFVPTFKVTYDPDLLPREQRTKGSKAIVKHNSQDDVRAWERGHLHYN